MKNKWPEDVASLGKVVLTPGRSSDFASIKAIPIPFGIQSRRR